MTTPNLKTIECAVSTSHSVKFNSQNLQDVSWLVYMVEVVWGKISQIVENLQKKKRGFGRLCILLADAQHRSDRTTFAVTPNPQKNDLWRPAAETCQHQAIPHATRTRDRFY